MMKLTSLVAATFNAHKVAELGELFAPWGITIKSLKEYTNSAPEENGNSFQANALLKARYGFLHSGLPTLADDSGLEVDALGREPGIYSARYAGEGAGDVANYNKLLENLQGVTNRQARFRCVLALVGQDFELTAEGACGGQILEAPQGSGGFGYDPVFWLPELGKSFAELTQAQKNQLSHRAIAFQELLELLKRLGMVP